MFFFSFKYIQTILPMRLTSFKLFMNNILIPKERNVSVDDVPVPPAVRVPLIEKHCFKAPRECVLFNDAVS